MRTTTIIGILLIVLGFLFLGPMLGLFTLRLMWPAILLLIGIGFFLAYIAAPKIYGFLMSGAVLVISSIPFFMCTFSNNWQQMAVLWPIFLFSVAVGFFLMYFLGAKKNGLLVSGLVLLSLGAISFLIFNYIKFVFPILFLFTGLVLVFIGLVAKKKEKEKKADSIVDSEKKISEEYESKEKDG